MDFMPAAEGDLTPIWITLYFDRAMQMIVGKPVMRSMVNRGCPFALVLECLLIDYPEIQKRYPPGVLSFTLNGTAPELWTPLADGDRAAFFVEHEMPNLLS